MNIKLHTPKSLASGSGMSSRKQFLLSLLATTISIILTFGTAAIIDHRKKEKEKHEIVMMVMYDMHKSLKAIENVDSLLRQSMQLQVQVAQDTTQFDALKNKIQFMVPNFEYTETVERIFSTTIETISTVGNVLFTENVADFYLNRRYYKTEVCDSLLARISRDYPYATLRGLLDFDFFFEAALSSQFLLNMQQRFAQCMQMMDVTDEDIEAYTKAREQMEKSQSEKHTAGGSALEEVSQLQRTLNEAKEALGW